MGYTQIEWMTLCLAQADDFTLISWKQLNCVIFILSDILNIHLLHPIDKLFLMSHVWDIVDGWVNLQ